MFEPDIERLNDLVYWFPVLQRAGIPVPETLIVHRGDCDLIQLLDGKMPKGIDSFESRLLDAMETIGFPCFLRTGMTSNKHDWKYSCYVADRSYLSHVTNLVEMSEMANFIGPALCYDFWAVRKLIPTDPITTWFSDMPIAMEIRCFIRGGKVECTHPYWPLDALEGANETVLENARKLQVLPEEGSEVYEMAGRIAKLFSGYWSVDFLQDKDGKWWCTDMAVGDQSYHWPDCSRL